MEKNNEMERNFEQIAMQTSAVCLIGNGLLSVGKLAAGLLAHSGAMVSDAIHSASDVCSTIIVMIGVHLSGKSSDKEHPYGHERLECVAAIILAVILCITGLGIGASALSDLIQADTQTPVIPGILAGIAAIVSIVVKEGMFRYTRHFARKIDSGALMADAWHHRSDALSSVGALIGIAGARLGFPIADPIASLVICIFIEKAGIEIFKDAIDKMVDKSCDEETEQTLQDFILHQEGVQGIDLLQTRMFGSRIYVDTEISVDGQKSLQEAHAIAETVHRSIEQTFPKVKHIMVHVNPAE
ncbi:MAG: cation transporter [Lachnospiraceae bacterium]|nr:cation transporter [Lachnospiraceae bacterium]